MTARSLHGGARLVEPVGKGWGPRPTSAAVLAVSSLPHLRCPLSPKCRIRHYPPGVAPPMVADDTLPHHLIHLLAMEQWIDDEK
jgi:hypothetical protein